MDVLEHVENDVEFYNNIINKLKNNGTILITVPAYQFLFSIHDVRSSHFRRYNKKNLLNLIMQQNIVVERCHYFYTSLLFVRILFLINKDKFNGNDIKWKYSKRHIITKIFVTVLNIDFYINRILDKINIRLPGLSLLAVCRKVEKSKSS
jgi:hypothetical protein